MTTAAVDFNAVVRALHDRGWRQSQASGRHAVFTKLGTGRVVVVPLGFEQVADGVFRTVLLAASAGEPFAVDSSAATALARLDTLFSRHPVEEDVAATVRAERDTR